MGQLCCCFCGRAKAFPDTSESTLKATNNGNITENACLKPANPEETGHGSKVSSSNGVAVNGKEHKKVIVSGPKPAKGGNQSALLVELFTSQGCSSCPPADALISRLGRGEGEDVTKDVTVPLIVLAYHVEYWDYLGWKDPFASSAWTLRQRAYGQALQQDSMYTPEVVVQGRNHCIASDSTSVMALIQATPRFPAPDVSTSFSWSTPSTLKMSLSVSVKFKVEGYSLDVMVAMYENGLVTDCLKGENKGRILTNDFVVRRLEKVCTLKDWPSKKAMKGDLTLELWEGYHKSRGGLVVFLQNTLSLEICGAQQLELPDRP